MHPHPLVAHHVDELLAVVETAHPLLAELVRSVVPEIVELEADALATGKVLVVGRAGATAVTVKHRGVLVRDLRDEPDGSPLGLVREKLREPPPRDHYYFVLIDVADQVRAAVVEVDLPPGDPRRRSAAS